MNKKDLLERYKKDFAQFNIDVENRINKALAKGIKRENLASPSDYSDLGAEIENKESLRIRSIEGLSFSDKRKLKVENRQKIKEILIDLAKKQLDTKKSVTKKQIIPLKVNTKKEALIRKYIYEYKNKGESGNTTLTLIRELGVKIRTQTFYRLWRQQKISEQKVLSEKPKQKITIPEKLKRQIPAKSKMFTIRVILINLKTRKIVMHQVQVFETSPKFAKSEAKDTAENHFNSLGGSPTWKAVKAVIVSIQRI